MADIQTVTVNGVTYNVKDDTATSMISGSVTLTTAGWSDKSQTVNLEGVTASNTLFIAPASLSATAYYSAEVQATTQAAGKLTFACETVPTMPLTVNVVIFD